MATSSNDALITTAVAAVELLYSLASMVNVVESISFESVMLRSCNVGVPLELTVVTDIAMAVRFKPLNAAGTV